MTIKGTNFLGGALVLFGTVNALTVTVNSATQIRAFTPPNAAVAVDVTVQGPDGQSDKLAGGSAFAASTSNGHYDGTIKVSGKNLVNGSGQVLKIAGVNSQAEIGYSADRCTRTDGDPSSLAVHAANIASWKANIVRFFMDEDCWLNINGVVNGGATYQANVQAYVASLHSQNLYVLMSLSSAAPGTTKSTTAQAPTTEPDADYSITFWSEVARAYKNDHGVIFELFNEPYGGAQDTAEWQCLMVGVVNCATNSLTGTRYTSAGVGDMIAAVRNAGATTQPIMVAGLYYSHDLTRWLEFVPPDPSNSIVAQDHVYQSADSCIDDACLAARYDSIEAAGHPVIISEMGETDCAHGFVDKIMALADQHNVGYLAYAWTTNSCAAALALLQQFNPPIATGYGIGIFNHYQAINP